MDDARWLKSHGLQFQVDTNATALGQALAKLAREQLPFATAVALTRTAQDARDHTRGRLGESFTLRARKRVESGISINPARKQDWPKCQAEVGLKDGFMARQVTGGEKKPLAGTKHIAIPTRITQRGPGGGVVPAQKPRPIRSRKTGFVSDETGDASSPLGTKPGLVRERVAGRVVRKQKVEGFGPKLQRRARTANLGVVTWHLLRSKVHIEPRWKFPQQVTSNVGDRYPAHFLKEYEAAMRSARAQAGRMSTEAGRFFYLRARRTLGGF